MQILLTGANGFIGSAIYTKLVAAGYDVIAGVRDTSAFIGVYPEADAVRIDMNRYTSISDWMPLLENVDVVINCAGALQDSRNQKLWSIHYESPKALFDACIRSNIRRVIQISAISANEDSGTVFARSKLAGDDYLRGLNIDWVVLRPSLIYAEGSFGGTSTLRGLAGLPGFIPLVGREDAAFQPLHVGDLAKGILWLLENPSCSRITLEPVGPETVTTREFVLAYRKWLGFGEARIFFLPRFIQTLLAKLGDWSGVAAINSTSLKQLDYGNTTSTDWTETVPVNCQLLHKRLTKHPAQVQDRWHARLYFIKPLIRLSLVILWLGSAAAGLFVQDALIENWLANINLSPAPFMIALVKYGSISIDVMLGLWLIVGRNLKACYIAQLLMIVAYTIFFSIAEPTLWTAPLGSLLKNLPILILLGVAWATVDER